MRPKKLIGCLAWSAFGLLILACLMPHFTLPVDFLIAIGFGWVLYLARVLPEVRVNPNGLATGLVCLVLFTAGAHAFLSWLHGEMRGPEAGRWRWKWTGSLVAGLLLMFTAGLAATGVVHQVGWMLASREPLTDGGGARLAARRAQSMNNLKQVALAFHNYLAINDTFPPGLTVGEHGELLQSWQALILPFIEQAPLHDSIDFRRAWDDPVNTTAIRVPVHVYLNPAVPATHDASGLALSHYEGNTRVLGGTRRFRVADVTDGTGDTILAGEVADGFLPWGKPGHWRDPAAGINRAPGAGFGSPFPGGADVLFLDGSAKFLKNTIDPAVLKKLSTPAGGESVSADEY